MKTCGNSREILFRLGALAALPLLVASCGGGGGGGAKTVIVQKCDREIECTLKYEPELTGGNKTLLFELSIPAGALEESAEISIEQSDGADRGLSFMSTYKVLPETLKFITGKKAGLVLGYVYDKKAEGFPIGLQEDGLRIGKRNVGGGFDLLEDSGPPRLDVDQISGEVTGPGEYAVVFNPIIFSVSPEVGRSSSAEGAKDGTVVTVSGINFQADTPEGSSGLIVKFNKKGVPEDHIKPERDKEDTTLNITLPFIDLEKKEKEEDLKGALTITVLSGSGSGKKRLSNSVIWGFGTGFDAAVYDLSGGWGKLAVPGSTECTTVDCLTQPWGIARDEFDCIYVADTANHKIKKFTPAGLPVSATTTSCPPFADNAAEVGTKGTKAEKGKISEFNTPLGIAVDKLGNIYVADSLNHRIVLLDKDGKVREVTVPSKNEKGEATTANVNSFGTLGDGSGTAKTDLNQPSGIALDPSGNIFVVDTLNNRVVMFDPTTGTETVEFKALGEKAGNSKEFRFNQEPSAIAFDSASTPNGFYVADPGNYRILYFKRTTKEDKTFTDELDKAIGKPAGTNEGKNDLFLKPVGVAVDVRGSMYVVDKQASRIQKFDRSANYLPSTVGNPKDKTQLAEPTTIVVDSKANLYVLDRTLSKVQKFAPR